MGGNNTEVLIYILKFLSFKFAVLLKGGKREEEKPFRDCADVYQAGFNKSGIYTIYFNNMPEPKKVRSEVLVYGWKADPGWIAI